MKLSFKEKMSFGVGAIGKDMVYMLSAGYILYYYQNILGINAVFVGMLLMVARIFDAANDPFMGILVAKTRTRFGKFRPWLLSGTILNALVLYAMFAVPEGLEGKGLLIYVSVAYILWGVTYTMMDIPFWSMIPAFTSEGKEREGMSTLGRTCAGVGAAIITVVTVKAVELLGGGSEREGFKWFALIVAVVFALSAILLCTCIKEKSTVNMPAVSIKDMFKALFRNDQAMVLVVAIILINTSVYITTNLVIYFFKYDFGGADWENSYTLFNMFGGAVQILSMMVIYPLMRKFMSAIKVFFVALFTAIVGYLVLLGLACTELSNLYLLFIPGFLIFAASGILPILTTVFLADSVDYGEWKNKRRDDSVIFSMQTFMVKLASGVAVMLASVCLEVFSISDNTDVEIVLEQSSVVGLRMSMTIIPTIGLIIAFFYFKKKFKLTQEKMKEITAELKKN